MSGTASALETYRDEFARLAPGLSGAGGARAARAAALEQFLARGLPTTREEDWKYTNVATLGRRAYPLAARADAGAQAGAIAPLLIEGAHTLVFLDGHPEPALSRAADLPAGARIVFMREALARGEDPAALLAVPESASSFAHMNAALGPDGVLVELAPDCAIEAPVHLLFVATGAATGHAQYPRVVIRAGRGARATVIEHYAATGETGHLTSAVTLVTLGEGSAIDHYRVQEEAAQAHHVGLVDATLQASSRLVQHSIALGGRLARVDVRVRLAAAGAEVMLNGLYCGRERQHLDHHTRIDHLVPHTASDEHYRGVLDGHARGVFNGKVVVHPQAQKSVAHQSNRNLLLAPTAEVDTKPELEIYADDVQCSHGATIGQLDAAALFYLRSRGIDERTARGLLVYAFADDIIARVTVPALRRRLEAAVLGRMPDELRMREFV